MLACIHGCHTCDSWIYQINQLPHLPMGLALSSYGLTASIIYNFVQQTNLPAQAICAVCAFHNQDRMSCCEHLLETVCYVCAYDLL